MSISVYIYKHDVYYLTCYVKPFWKEERKTKESIAKLKHTCKEGRG